MTMLQSMSTKPRIIQSIRSDFTRRNVRVLAFRRTRRRPRQPPLFTKRGLADQYLGWLASKPAQP